MSINRNFFLKLLKERKRELKLLVDTTRDQSRPVELDQTKVGRLSRMDAMQHQAMAKETERRRKFDLKRIEAAITRLNNDDFGFCTGCDEPIPLKRLEFDPACLTCVSCANK
tara:strand:+ start:102 stop:437 length:336 start_codon:yes stop_codon:yes gene_type:complete